MTEKQMLFAEEYLKDLNATRAYLSVYKNVKSDRVASACASKLLAKANVKAYIDDRLEAIHNDNTADINEVMEYLTSVMRKKSKAEVVVVEGTGKGYSKARTIEKAPDEKEALKAAELLGKRFGLFDANQVEDVHDEVVIINDAPEEDS
ncbi:terminase small subunit [Absicoccus intestinalis]|uniref:Terminase small subunit n=1 Tax=Absicoccus intestinalis TaxID=2926319 RepID=A0ABU4WJ45_9FIRM|nr:terminase small subunit [Absicoccus sp. CLA-KB-P134]MDX8416571.1 terminase small subunit [Absicoccus sp. CLA-KB-P134]